MSPLRVNAAWGIWLNLLLATAEIIMANFKRFEKGRRPIDSETAIEVTNQTRARETNFLQRIGACPRCIRIAIRSSAISLVIAVALWVTGSFGVFGWLMWVALIVTSLLAMNLVTHVLVFGIRNANFGRRKNNEDSSGIDISRRAVMTRYAGMAFAGSAAGIVAALLPSSAAAQNTYICGQTYCNSSMVCCYYPAGQYYFCCPSGTSCTSNGWCR